MKVIDFKTKGNVIRLALGANNCDDYWGDDWDDTPYEHNAGPVYDQYVAGYATIYVPFNFMVLTPKDCGTPNSEFCKEDFKYGVAPCILIVEDDFWGSYSGYSRHIGNKNAFKIYFEDELENGEYLYMGKKGLVCLTQ